jgi:hypothetical protein
MQDFKNEGKLLQATGNNDVGFEYYKVKPSHNTKELQIHSVILYAS